MIVRNNINNDVSHRFKMSALSKGLISAVSALAILIVSACTSNNNELIVNFNNEDREVQTYSLPFEKGYLYNDGHTLRILLTFYKKNEWFKKDSSERLHLYIYGQEENFKEREHLGEIKAFFIRVQVRPDYGFLKAGDLALGYGEKGKINISGMLSSKSSLPRRGTKGSLGLKFAQLPLVQVKSFKDISSKDNDYFRKILQENIADIWH
jgi:hypothetical protein